MTLTALDRLATWVRAHRVDLLLVLLALVAVGPFVQRYTAQPAARYVATAAMWDDHTIDLDGYRHAVWIDSVEYEGELRSDKAPLQPLLAVPFYAIARAAGAEPASTVRATENLGLWWVTFWSSVVPFAALLVMMRRAALRYSEPTVALVSTLAIGFGTLFLPFSSQLYGQVLEAGFAFAAWMAVRSASVSNERALLSGALAGAAVATGYTAGVVAVALAVYVLTRHRTKTAAFLLGALPFALLVAAHNWLAFGSPLRVSYGVKPSLEGGAFGLGSSGLHPEHVVEALAGARGYLFMSPIVLLALAAALIGAFKSERFSTECRMALGVAAGYAILVSLWPNPWGGDMPGPRYVIPLMPFLVVPLASIWKRLPLVATGLSLVSVAVMVLPTITTHLVVQSSRPIIDVYVRRLFEEPLVPTLWTMAVGRSGWLLHVAAVAMVLYALFATRNPVVADART